MMRIAPLALLLTILSPATLAETVYKFTDKSGTEVYSDTPVQGATAIEIQRPMIVPAEKIPPKAPPADARPVARYLRVTISTPGNDTVFNNDPSPVVVTGTSEPDLMPGHRFRLSLDGAPVGQPSPQPTFTLPPPDRGTHTLLLEIVDGSGMSITRSAPVQFHVRRHSVLFRKTP